MMRAWVQLPCPVNQDVKIILVSRSTFQHYAMEHHHQMLTRDHVNDKGPIDALLCLLLLWLSSLYRTVVPQFPAAHVSPDPILLSSRSQGQ